MADFAQVKTLLEDMKKKMAKGVEATKKEFQNIRTGRASIALVEGISVNYYDTPTPLKNIGTISTPDARTIQITPWDATALPEIEKAILKSDLGLMPMNDGKVIRIQIPPLTDERRNELTRVVRKVAEEGRVSIRTSRHEAIEQVKKLEKAKTIPEDVSFAGQKEIQKVTDQVVAQIDEALKQKEAELGAI
ncbi:MAG: Ribosome-recycling factor [Candidatus Omnitrophica bacterium ADurb.Bin292]|mgnify:CR=1 FL=1|jgi:ribosome recycling factor|nr:MAG: Ribosome-recycling factor [Candidatus Omnitrophica bacterium ADurb.Bin292]HOG23983.1 ribosome recycling factor [Candidatus Omnitrophota bacterium]HPW77593.1 ribosome recycling factor [Candidatus Omnitrophota bacterium]HQB12751.1 ribosome recycling factor [Candidatus Omnitrophota bacterium]